MTDATVSRVTPFLMFTGDAEAAMSLYTSLFTDGRVVSLTRYGPGEPGAEGTVKHATFVLAGQRVMCIDSPAVHEFGFTPAMSLHVRCDSDDDLDRLYEALSDGGQVLMPRASYDFAPGFAWVNDRFGVSWQLQLADGTSTS